jgi:hypothetical protein
MTKGCVISVVSVVKPSCRGIFSVPELLARLRFPGKGLKLRVNAVSRFLNRFWPGKGGAKSAFYYSQPAQRRARASRFQVHVDREGLLKPNIEFSKIKWASPGADKSFVSAKAPICGSARPPI